MVTLRAHLLPIAIVLIVAGALFRSQGIDTSADSLWYLAASSSLIANEGYVDFTGEAIANRGPLFAWALSLGQSPWLTINEVTDSTYLVMRGLMVINLVLIYLASSALFSRWTGVVAVLLTALTFVFHQAHSRIIVDPLVPLFTLATLWLLACVRPLRAWQAGLAGGVLGLGFVAKEVVVVFVAAPFVYSILSAIRGRSWKALALLVYVFAFVLVIAVWALAAGLIRDDVTQLLGWAGPKVLAMFGVNQQTPLLDADTGGLIRALTRLYNEHLMTLGWLTPFALAAVGINALSLRRGHLLLTAFILCWFPVALYIGQADLRPGQSLVLIIMLLMSLAAMVTSGVATVLRDVQWPNMAWVVSAVLGVGVCVLHGALQRDTQSLFLGERVNRTAPFALPITTMPPAPLTVTGILPRI